MDKKKSKKIQPYSGYKTLFNKCHTGFHGSRESRGPGGSGAGWEPLTEAEDGPSCRV